MELKMVKLYLPWYRRDHIQFTLYQSDSLPLQQLEFNPVHVRPSLEQAQDQKPEKYVGRQGKRENSWKQPQELNLPLTCVPSPCSAKIRNQNQRGKPSRQGPLILAKEVGSNKPSGLTALFQEADYLLHPRVRQKEWNTDKTKPLLNPAKSRFCLEWLLRCLLLPVT